MAILKTNCESITGRILYSDTYAHIPGYGDDEDTPEITNMPTLNTIAAIPILGHLAGATRIALSIIHMIGHSFAALIFWDSGHMCHVAKGGAEFLRGIIEILPIVGRLFAWSYDARAPIFPHNYSTVHSYSFFLVKIYNPDKLDNIDYFLVSENSHPYLSRV